MIKRSIVWSIIILCSIFIHGCNFQDATIHENDGYQVVDSQGIKIKLETKPQRIVSLTLCSDEILLSLLDEKRLAACSSRAADYGISNIAAQAQDIPVLSSKSVEGVLACRPDLVIASDWLPAELIDSLREVGLQVYVYKTPATIAEVKTLVMKFGELVGEEERSKSVVEEMNAILSKVQEKVNKISAHERKVVMALSFMGCYGGKGSMLDDIYKYAGVVNGAAIAGLEKNDVLAKEQLVAVNPDLIMIPTWDYEGKGIENFKQEVIDDPAFSTVKAVKNKQLIQVEDKYTYCTSQYVVYAVRDLIEVVYP